MTRPSYFLRATHVIINSQAIKELFDIGVLPLQRKCPFAF